MHKVLLFFFSLITFLGHASHQVEKTDKPSWVNSIQINNDEVSDGVGGYQYLLIDRQDNLLKEAVYRHYVIKVINAEGFQDVSDYSFEYDPSYQQLMIHEVKIKRGAEVIDKLENYDLQVIQRESSMERFLYDGSLTAVINLTDVRVGDEIEYSYTLVGFNPIKDGNYSNTFYFQFASPINRIYTRIIKPAHQYLQFKYFDGGKQPKEIKKGEFIEYIWDEDATDFKLYDAYVPSWYNCQRRVAVSTFKSWGDVVDLAVPWYEYNYDNEVDLEFHIGILENKENRVQEIIRWVQDEVRYLGFESGISAFKPHNPVQVFKQRYGDCKDKSLLLISLLRKEGLKAYPLWVNYSLTKELPKELPSYDAFNHVIVYFQFNGYQIFIDPTISNQGGSILNTSLPSYKYGLLIKHGQNELISIPESLVAETNIYEDILVKEIGGEAFFKVKTEYTDSKADEMRSYFHNNSLTSIQKEYLDYYSHLYPDIEQAEDIIFIDEDRKSSNKIITIEKYRIPGFWFQEEGSNLLYAETYPLVLESLIDYSYSAERTMPYSVGNKKKFTQNIKINMPEEWNVDYTRVNIEGDGFYYLNTSKGTGNTVEVHHSYSLDKEYIEGSSYNDFKAKHEDIKGELSFYITYNKDLAGFKLSLTSVLIILISLGIVIFFALRVYKNYDPVIAKSPTDLAIGGWLILPAIGLSISPFVLIYQFVSLGFLNDNTWQAALLNEQVDKIDLILVFGIEMVYNVLFLTFLGLTLVLFFQRRSNLPRVITIFYLVSFIGSIADTLLVNNLMPGLYDASDYSIYTDGVRGFIVACVWIPYFNISKRVKNTFCKLYDKTKETEVYVEPDPILSNENNKPKSDMFL